MLRSNFEPGTTRWAVRRAQWVAMGISEEDFDKPKIAVVNSSSELSVCYQHLDGLALLAKEAIRNAGGLPFEIRTVAPSDFITSAGRQARYLLPSRDLLVNDIEVQVEGACLDGMLLLGSCDKTTPAQLMAAARLNVPSVVVPCGYQLGGVCGGKEVDIEEVYKAVGTVKSGQMPLSRLKEWTNCAIKGPGVCAGMATANSMHCLAEALGMAISATTPIRADSDRLKNVIRRAGSLILKLVMNNVCPRDIITPAAISNAAHFAVALGCSVNTVRHLTAISVEAGLDIDVVGLFEKIGQELPLIANVRPNGPVRIEEFDEAGGTYASLKSLRQRLDLDARTVDYETLRDALDVPRQFDTNVIRNLENPINSDPGLAIVRGNLAPHGAVVKLSAIPTDCRIFEGVAVVFEDEDEAIELLGRGKLPSQSVVVLRMMGPKGGPGTVFACGFMAAMVGAGCEESIAVLTDGELSGLNRGIVVGQIMPEAAEGGPLAIVESGDRICIDLAKRRIDLLVSSQELQTRLGMLNIAPPQIEPGWLAMYRQLVQPLSHGAVLGERAHIQSPSPEIKK